MADLQSLLLFMNHKAKAAEIPQAQKLICQSSGESV